MNKLRQRILTLKKEEIIQHEGENIERKMQNIESEKNNIIDDTLILLNKLLNND